MNEFTFQTDERAMAFCLEIAAQMVSIFGISKSEAIGRIDKHWEGQRFEGPDLIYQRDVSWWAQTIYYEAGTYWWLDWWMQEHRPKPKPYP